VLYEHEGQLLLGAVLGFKRQRFVILNERGREVELTANRLHSVVGHLPHDLQSQDARKEFLSALAERARTLAPTMAIHELWEVVHHSPKEFSVVELLDLASPTQGASADASATFIGLFHALIQDKVFFKRERTGFSPRPPATVEQLQRAEVVRLAKQAARSVFIQWVRARMSDHRAPPPADALTSLELLEEVAAGAPHLDNSAPREAKEIVDSCVAEIGEKGLGGMLSGNRERRAYQLLERIKWFSPLTNLSLYRHRPARRLSSEVLEEAASLVMPQEFAALTACGDALSSAQGGTAPQRLDLTAAQSFTVDDVSTLDMDDAISFEQTPGGYELGIHISDLSSYLPPNSALDSAARYRATSIYLPDQVIPMLPPSLSEDTFSLQEGKLRPCLSCIVSLNQSLKVLDAKIRPSVIRSTRRFSYDEFERLLLDPSHQYPTYAKLYELTVGLEEERAQRGAQKVYKRDLIIEVRADGTCALREIDEHGPARALVGELIARYAVEHKLPVVVRRQDPPEAPLASRSEERDAASDYAERARMKKSSIGVDPAPHSGLGLDAYLQATSPIRRYIDLLNQRQILHHLSYGKPLYTRTEVEEIILATENPLGVAATVSKESRRFWLLRYLSQRMAKPPSPSLPEPDHIMGTVLRTDLRHPLVELDEIFMPTLVKFSVTPRVGERIRFKIVAIDPQQDHLRLEPT
jgi:exoribonuclease-2